MEATLAAASNQDAAKVLDERERELDERQQTIMERQRDLEERNRGADAREQELDERRRQLVQQWAHIDEQGHIFREQSSSLDASRRDLGRRREELNNRQQELLKRRQELTQEDIREGRMEAVMLGHENEALRTQLSVDIDRYNLDYDSFLVGLKEHIGRGDSWREQMAAWLSDRQQHNVDVNQRNQDRRSLGADIDVLMAQHGQLQQDIKAHIGPYIVDESVRADMTGEMGQRLGRHNDRLLVGTQFELLCVDLLRAMAFHVQHEGGTDDRGIDIRAEETARSGETFRYIIQCKYKGRNSTVGRTAIAQFAGDLPSSAEYDKAVFVTAGRFEADAAEHAEQRGISVWNGVWLCQRLIDEEVGFKVTFSTTGYDIQFDDAYWDELVERAKKLRAGSPKDLEGPSPAS